MSKIAILADIHFGARNDNPHLLYHHKEFFTKQFFPELKKQKIDTVYILGDVFDHRVKISVGLISEVAEFFFKPLKDFKVHVLVGNHDTFYKHTNTVNSVELIMQKYVPHAKIVVNKVGVEIQSNKSILMVPWITQENVHSIMTDLKTMQADYVFGHFEINGFEMTRGNLCEHGLKQSVFAKFDTVLSGHFHLRSKLGNISYVGSPIQMDWNDYDSLKGFGILDTSTSEVTYVNNTTKQFMKLTVGDEMDDINCKSCFVKLFTNDNTASQLEAVRAKIVNQEVADLQVIDEGITLQLDDSDQKKIDTLDTNEAIKMIVDSLETTDVDKDALIKLMNGIYERALKNV